MAFTYKNPISDSQLNTVESVSRDKAYGTNFSVLQVGGYMEVYTLDDLKFTVEGTGPIELSGNTIPVRYSKRTLPFLNDTLTLNSDNISSGRRRLGMLVYVHETQKTYQYTIPNFETLWDGASGSTTEDQYGTSITTSTTGGTAFINAWLDNTIEGVSGVTRDNARWKVFYGTDWQITGGTYNSGTGTLSLDNNTGGTINVTGFTSGGGSNTYVSGGTITYNSQGLLQLNLSDDSDVDITGLTSITGATLVGSTLTLSDNLGGDITVTGFTTVESDTYITGGTYSSGTTTLTLSRNDGNTVDVTGFTSGGSGSLTLQDVTDNGSSTTNGITVASLTSTGDIIINEDITAGNGGGGLSGNTVFGSDGLVVNSTGVKNSAFGFNALSANTVGENNTAVGYQSLATNINGDDNTSLGHWALYSNNNGSDNVAIGSSALFSQSSSSRNVGVGKSALSGVNGNDNIGVGYQAGAFDSNNQPNSSATNSIYIGKNSKADSSGGQNEIVIGTDAIGNGSNTITLGNTAHTDTYLFGTVHGVPYLTGGSYSNGTLTLEDFDGGSFDITGLDSDDTYLTGATYTPTTLTLGMNDGTEFSVGGFAPEITGGTLSNGTLSLLDNTNGSVDITGFTTTGNLYSADGQLEGNRVVDQDSNSLTFSGGSVSMGTGTTTPVCALLELASTNQGLLIPRMTQAQRLAISSPIAGLIVYCTNSDSNGDEGMYMYKSLGWVNVL